MNSTDLLRQIMAMLEHDHALVKAAASSQTPATHEYEFFYVC
jgi:hypothetical protein